MANYVIKEMPTGMGNGKKVHPTVLRKGDKKESCLIFREIRQPSLYVMVLTVSAPPQSQ